MVDVRKDRVPRFKSQYDRSSIVGCSFLGDEGMTEQSHKDSCDINVILSRYAKTGALPGMIKENPRYGDFSSIASYQDSLNIVIDAQNRFAALDAPIRRRFGNDPALFVEFALDPKNGPELVKMGLAVARVSKSESVALPNVPPVVDSEASSKASAASKPKP